MQMNWNSLDLLGLVIQSSVVFSNRALLSMLQRASMK